MNYWYKIHRWQKKRQLLFRVQDKNSKKTPAVRMNMGGEQIAYEIQTDTLHLYDMNTETNDITYFHKIIDV